MVTKSVSKTIEGTFHLRMVLKLDSSGFQYHTLLRGEGVPRNWSLPYYFLIICNSKLHA